MPNVIAVLLFASSVGLSPGGPALSAGDAKCGGRPGSHPDLPETVVILDDRLIEVEIPDFDLDDHDLENSDMHSFGFVCWRWIEEHHGFRIQSTGVYVVTVDWVERREANQLAALEAVVAAQDRYRETNGQYAREAAELPGFGNLADYGLPSYFELDLTATDDGWGALVRASRGWSQGVEYGVPKGCIAFVGAVPDAWKTARGKEGPEFRERQPVCSWGLAD
ncbi:MAG: hypothetical protein F4059_10115 [Gemmatimonadetes bacterium]|nr:hypothetical protein [Gemmatimonadota bacterium]